MIVPCVDLKDLTSSTVTCVLYKHLVALCFTMADVNRSSHQFATSPEHKLSETTDLSGYHCRMQDLAEFDLSAFNPTFIDTPSAGALQSAQAKLASPVRSVFAHEQKRKQISSGALF